MLESTTFNLKVTMTFELGSVLINMQHFVPFPSETLIILLTNCSSSGDSNEVMCVFA